MIGQAERTRLVVIQGPTGTGKSELAVRLAEQFGGEIVGADSLQVYRGMVIGSAAPGADLLSRVRHHLVGIVEPDAPFTAADYAREADNAIADIYSRGRTVFVAGGTGLYIRALLGGLINAPAGNDFLRSELEERADSEGMAALFQELLGVDPVTAGRLHPHDRTRIIRALEVYRATGRLFSELTREHGFSASRYNVLKIGLTRDRDELYQRVELRVDRMLAEGFIDEVRELLQRGFSPELKSMRAIGYKELCRHLDGLLSLDDAVKLMKRDTRRYVKRQLTWFLHDTETKWFEYPEKFASICSAVAQFQTSSS